MDQENKKLSRRKFVNTGIQGTTLLGLNPLLLTGRTPREQLKKTVKGACYHDCPDTCSWEVTSEQGKVTRFEASSSNPFTAGSLCNKMVHFPDDVTFHPDRILTPLKRTGAKGSGEFERIGWSQALSEIAQQLKNIVSHQGGEAILPFGYAGTEGLVQNDAMSSRFFARLGASKLGRTICGDTAATGVALALGSTTGVLPEDMVHSKFIILWGTNPVISNPHLIPYLDEAKKAGARVVLVDPYRSASASIADWHIQPRPGTDVVLALAMIHTILRENLWDEDYVASYTTGIEELRSHVQKYDPETAAQITGISVTDIEHLAVQYAQSQPSLIRVLIGMEKSNHGANAFWAIAMLPALVGAWRKPGGGLLHFTFELFGECLNWEGIDLANSIAEGERRTINMVELGKVLTDHDLQPPVKSLFVYNSNPAVIVPNQNLVIEGLKRNDLLTVVIEHFMTDTARYADYIFPATSQLEHWDLMISWGQCYINLNEPALEPLGEAKPNCEFFRLLAKQMDFDDAYFSESDLKIIKTALKSKHPYLKGIDFKYLLKHGWARLQLPDPWLPHATGNFRTKSGKCEFYSQALAEEGKSPLPDHYPVQKTTEDHAQYPLQLLSIKSTRYFLNTSHANIEHLRTAEGDPKIEIHQTDAISRNLKNGDWVMVFNQRGEIQVKVEISQKVKEGIVMVPQGFWSSLTKGGSSVNALTTDKLSDMGGGSALQETKVEVKKI
ncbi:MAG: molybdopterin-dependent oxidoreductase [Saprospiraceae bacterium]|nr:molybdopterin-dependent oxidoreductase [Saprospiraceae bacterium]